MDSFELAALPFLAGYPDGEPLLSAFSERSHAAGEELFHRGDTVEGVGILLSGRIGIRKETGLAGKTQVVALLDAGAPFGERALVGGTVHRSGAVVVEACRVALLPVASWELFRQQEPELALMFQGWLLAAVIQRLEKASERLAHIL